MFFYFMKLKHLKYPLSISLILVLWTACDFINPPNTTQIKAMATPKTVRTVTYIDNGAVVPIPNKRQVTFTVEDSTKIALTYAELKENMEEKGEKITISDPERLENVYDNILEIADLPDGIDVKPGKQPCVGSQGIDVSVFYSNGDTMRFSIMGGARCDKTLCPSFWTLDSLANLLIHK